MADQGGKPDIFVQLLSKMDRIDEIAADVREIKIGHGVRLDRIEAKLVAHDLRFEQIDRRFEQIDRRFDEVGVALLDVAHDVKQHSHDITELKTRLAS